MGCGCPARLRGFSDSTSGWLEQALAEPTGPCHPEVEACRLYRVEAPMDTPTGGKRGSWQGGGGGGAQPQFPHAKEAVTQAPSFCGVKTVGSVGWKGVNYASLPLANRKQVRSGPGTGLGARSLSQTRGIS